MSPTTDPERDAISLGPWTIEPARRRVRGPAGDHRLEPKVMGVLLVLAKQAGGVVTRDALLSAVWGDAMATEDVLSRAISELRRAIGDDPRHPRLIETIRGVGYCLNPPQPTPPVRARPWHVWRLAGSVVALSLGLTTVMLAARRHASVEWSPAPFTSEPGEEADPSISPDSRVVAYVATPRGSAAGDLFTRPLNGPSARRLTVDGGYRYPSWSSDGARIAVARSEPPGWAIYELSATGGSRRLVAHLDGAFVLGLAWAPDGKSVIVSAPQPPTAVFGLRRIAMSSGTVSVVTDGGSAALGDAFPVVAPDGARVVFARFVNETDADLFMIDARGGTPAGAARRLTFDPRPVAGLAFTPDGAAVLFAADRGSGFRLWRLTLDDRSTRPEPAPLTHVAGVTAAADGRSMVAEELRLEANIWRVPSIGGQPVDVVSSTHDDALPDLDPAGQRIAFQSDRSGSPAIWLSPIDGRDARQLTADSLRASAPRWSPDGASVLFEGRAGETTRVFVVDIATGVVRAITPQHVEAFGASWSRRGDAVYFATRDGGSWNIRRQSIGTARADTMTTDGGIAPREGDGGGALYYAKPTTAGLWRLDLRSGQRRMVAPDVPPGDWTNWAVGRRGVYYVRRAASGSQHIVYREFGAPDARVIVPSVRVPIGVGGLAVSPDERAIFYGQVDQREGDLYLLRRP